jgi:hypothetical protein
MSVLDRFVKVFSVVLVAVWFLVIGGFLFFGQSSVSVLVFLTVFIPVFVLVSEFRHLLQFRRFLPCLYVVPFVFWGFDVATTFLAINVYGVAEEANPLGWPWGALGGLVFYIPAFASTYWLSHGEKSRYRLLVAVLITGLACCVGITNFFAGLHNLNLISRQSLQ